MSLSSIIDYVRNTAGSNSFLTETIIAVVLIILATRFLILNHPLKAAAEEADVATKPVTQEKRPLRHVTLRIDDIPAGISQMALERNLKSVGDRAVYGFQEALHNLTIRSLVRRDDRFSMATATVTTSLPAKRLAQVLQEDLKAAGFIYRCDCDFYGITPLHESQGSASDICEYARFAFVYCFVQS